MTARNRRTAKNRRELRESGLWCMALGFGVFIGASAPGPVEPWLPVAAIVFGVLLVAASKS